MVGVVELEDALLEWGRAYGEYGEAGERAVIGGSVGSFGKNPIATAMEYGARIDKSNDAAYRRPREAVRNWRDPCAGKQTRSYASALHFSGADAGGANTLILRIERAAVELYRVDTIMGLVMRAQYCKRGTQAEKVEWINAQGRASKLKLRTYRDYLVRGRGWMHGRLSV